MLLAASDDHPMDYLDVDIISIKLFYLSINITAEERGDWRLIQSSRMMFQ